jgi:DNA-binding XRE family transcriptional regulator
LRFETLNSAQFVHHQTFCRYLQQAQFFILKVQMRKPCNHYLNGLWLARKKVGLGQKNVARLLGHKTITAVSEYETGRLLPSLKTARKLAAIYRTPVCNLYAPLYGQIEQEVADAGRKISTLKVVAPNLFPRT